MGDISQAGVVKEKVDESRGRHLVDSEREDCDGRDCHVVGDG
jgi:hypothetical protein